MSIRLFGGNQYIDIKWWNFPAGERGVKIIQPADIIQIKSFTVHLKYQSDQDFMDMLLLVNAIRNINKYTRLRLCVPYFPYARQDRLMVEGESFSLQIAAQLIKSCNFEEVEIYDPHSDVLAGMFNPGELLVIPQWKLQEPIVRYCIENNKEATDYNVALVSPDAGALKKIYKLSEKTKLPVIEATKVRDPNNGQILNSSIDEMLVGQYDHLIICDDICGAGGTFIELARAIYRTGYRPRLDLITTHGIYDKQSLDELKKFFYNVLCVYQLKEFE